MQPCDDIPKVFWPNPCPAVEADGLLLGWHTGHVVVIAGVISHDGNRPVSLADAERALGQLAVDHAFESLRTYCGCDASVVGRWVKDPTATASNVEASRSAGGAAPSVWLDMTWHPQLQPPGARGTAQLSVAMAPKPDRHRIRVPIITSCQFGSHSKPFPVANINVILYRQPNPLNLEYFAARTSRIPVLHALGPTALTVKSLPGRGSRESTFDRTLAQLNAAAFAHSVVMRLVKEGSSTQSSCNGQSSPHNSRSTSDSQPAVPAPAAWRRAARQCLLPLFVIMVAVRMLAGLTAILLQARVPPSVPVIGGFSIYDHSTLARQLHYKLREFCRWPLLLGRVQSLRDDLSGGRMWHAPEGLFRDTAAVYDSTWRFVTDMVIGISACLVLANTPWAVSIILKIIHNFGSLLHIEVLRAWTDWLMGLPAGLKLNHFAGRKIGGAVLSVIELWEYITTFLTPFEPVIVVGVGFFGLGGASLLLAMASDVLELATLHLYLLYTQFAWLHNQQVCLLASLWKLFRGKKLNVLRSRVDSNDYDVAQLLLGTLLFTVVFFLFPTCLVYYVFFSSVWLGILATRAVLWWIITLLNNLPMFTTFAVVTQPRQVPAGVYLSMLRSDSPLVERLTTSRALLMNYYPGSLHYGSDSDDDEDGRDSGSIEEIISNAGLFGFPGSSSGGGSGSNSASSSASSSPAKQTNAPLGRPSSVSGTAAVATPQQTWFSLHTQPASAAILAGPFGEAFKIVTQRYSLGALLKTIMYGDRSALVRLPMRPAAPSAPAAPRPATAGAAAAAGASAAGTVASTPAPVQVVPTPSSSTAASVGGGKPRSGSTAGYGATGGGSIKGVASGAAAVSQPASRTAAAGGSRAAPSSAAAAASSAASSTSGSSLRDRSQSGEASGSNRYLQLPSGIGTWRDYWGALREVGDRLCGL